MEQKRKQRSFIVVGVLGLALLASVAGVSTSFAAEGDNNGGAFFKDGFERPFGKGVNGFMKRGMKNQMFKLHKQDQGMHKQIHDAIESGNYEAWEALMRQSPMAEKFTISRESFDKLQEIHRLRDAGEHEKAHELMKSFFGENFKPMKHKRFMNKTQGG